MSKESCFVNEVSRLRNVIHKQKNWLTCKKKRCSVSMKRLFIKIPLFLSLIVLFSGCTSPGKIDAEVTTYSGRFFLINTSKTKKFEFTVEIKTITYKGYQDTKENRITSSITEIYILNPGEKKLIVSYLDLPDPNILHRGQEVRQKKECEIVGYLEVD